MMQNPLMQLLAALLTALCALAGVWMGVAGMVRGTVQVFARSGGERYVAMADKPAAFWFCVLGWFVIAGMFAFLSLRYWRRYGEA